MVRVVRPESKDYIFPSEGLKASGEQKVRPKVHQGEESDF